VPARFLSDEQRERLSGFPPDLDAEALDQFFTLNDADLTEIRRRHRGANRLGWALHLCGLRMLGFCPDDVTNAPAGAVSFLAQQLGVDPGALAGYGVRAQTRTDHEAQVRRHLGFRVAAEADLRELRRWLAMEALVTDRPIVLFQLACARLYEERLVRPGLTVMERFLVGAAREAARAETARRVAPVLKAVGVGVLDGLLEADPDLGAARATWLRQSPVQASARAMNEEADKLEFLRQLGVESWDLSTLPGKRVTLLAGWARRSSTQALAQSSAERRYPALLAFGVDRLAGAIDTLVELFDTMVADTNAKARRRLGDYQQSIAHAANDKVLLLAKIVRVLLDPDLEDDKAPRSRVRCGAQGPPGARPGRVRAHRPPRRRQPRRPAGGSLFEAASVPPPVARGAAFPVPERR
jgi:hypothetical protein